MTEPSLPPLLATLARAVGAEGKPPELPAGEWPALLLLADRHRVTALLAASCSRVELPDQAIAADLARRRLITHAQERRSRLALLELAQALRHAGVWFIVLKGATVAERYYATPADRNAVDLDVLVAECDLGPAVHAVEALGYDRWGPARAFQGAPNAAQRAAAPDIAFTRSRDRIRLELHWRLSRNRQFPDWPIDALAPHVGQLDVGGATLPALAPSALLVHLACHGSRHLWFRLKWIADIDRAMRLMAPGEIAEASRIAGELGCARAFHTSLELSRSCFGTPLPNCFDPSQCHGALLRTMLRALIDPVDVRERYGPGDLRAAISIAYGRFLLRPDAAYRRELVRRTFVGIEEAEPGIVGAILARLNRKIGLVR